MLVHCLISASILPNPRFLLDCFSDKNGYRQGDYIYWNQYGRYSGLLCVEQKVEIAQIAPRLRWSGGIEIRSITHPPHLPMQPPTNIRPDTPELPITLPEVRSRTGWSQASLN